MTKPVGTCAKVLPTVHDAFHAALAVLCQVLGRQMLIDGIILQGCRTAGVTDVRGFGPRSRSACIGRGFCHAPVPSHFAFTGHSSSDLRQMRRAYVAHTH